MEVTANAEQVGAILKEIGYDLVAAATGKPIETPVFATAAIPR